jgi:hypothetical protein
MKKFGKLSVGRGKGRASGQLGKESGGGTGKGGIGETWEKGCVGKECGIFGEGRGGKGWVRERVGKWFWEVGIKFGKGGRRWGEVNGGNNHDDHVSI